LRDLGDSVTAENWKKCLRDTGKLEEEHYVNKYGRDSITECIKL
jgi:hypothetical protein